MSKFKIYCFIAGLFFVTSPSFGQLNEFMIQSYFYGAKPVDIGLEDFFEQLKKEYAFNSVFVIRRPANFNFDQGCKAVKKAGLTSTLMTNYLAPWYPTFYESLALQELNKYSQPEYTAMGYHVVDEPNAKTTFSPHGFNREEDGTLNSYIDYLPQYINLIKGFDESLLRYANLFPIGCFPGNNYKEYREEYLQKYIDGSHPNILSFDHYPIYNSNDPIYDFFISLYSFALKSSENGIPFIYVLTPYKKFADYLNVASDPNYICYAKNISEFRYVIYAALAYGTKGISYWPGFQWINNHSINPLQYDSEVIEKITSLHEKLAKHSDELLSLNFISAYHKSAKSTIGDHTEKLYDFNLWSNNFIKDPYARQIFKDVYSPLYEPYALAVIPNELAITFLANKSGQVYFWLFNKSLERKLSLVLNLWNPLRDVLNECRVTSTVTLEPGEGKLFTPLTPTYLASDNVNGMTFNDQLYPLTVNDELIIGATSNVVFNPGATKSFSANTITIKSMDAKEGSLVRFISYKDSNTKSNASFAKSYAEGNPTDTDALYQSYKHYVYPNPIEGNAINLHVDLCEGEEISVAISDISGRLLKKVETASQETSITVDGMQPGVFFVSFERDKQIYNLKVVKR